MEEPKTGISGKGLTDHTSNGLRLKYVAPGLISLSICCFDVIVESCFSMALTLKRRGKGK